MNDLIKRVADAIVGELEAHSMIERATDAMEAVFREDGYYYRCLTPMYLKGARAAIAALREPTQAMRRAGADHADEGEELPCWQAMIDEALK